MMLGTKIYKENIDTELYYNCSVWCNENEATIEDMGGYYEVVPLPVPSLDELKAQKLSDLKAERDALEVSPLNNYDVDQTSLARIDVANKVLETGNIQSISWTMADNSVQQVTAEDFSQLYIDLATRSNYLHEAYRLAKAEVLGAESAEELDSVKLEVLS